MTVTETYVQTFEVQSNTQIEAIITGNNSYTGRMYDSRIEFALNNVDQNVEDLLSGSVVSFLIIPFILKFFMFTQATWTVLIVRHKNLTDIKFLSLNVVWRIIY